MSNTHDVMGRIDREGIEVWLGKDEEGVPAVQIVDVIAEPKVLVSLTKDYQIYALIHALLKALEEA